MTPIYTASNYSDRPGSSNQLLGGLHLYGSERHAGYSELERLRRIVPLHLPSGGTGAGNQRHVLANPDRYVHPVCDESVWQVNRHGDNQRPVTVFNWGSLGLCWTKGAPDY